MGGKDRGASDKERLKEYADAVMSWLLENSQNFSPRQHIISQKVKNMLVEFVEKVENGKIEEATRMRYKIDDSLICLYQIWLS